MPRPARADAQEVRRAVRGASLPEVLIAVTVMTAAAAGAWRTLAEWQATTAGREAARGLVGDLRRVAHEARAQGRSLAVEFDLRAPAHLRILADGNGNGVTAAELAAGIDVPVGDWRLVFRQGRARLAVERALPGASGDGTVAAGSAPVQLGASPRLVFTPRGTASAGSVYVAGQGGRAYAIRVLGTTQRLRLQCLGRDDVWETC